MSRTPDESLVDGAWLEARLAGDELRIVDASWYSAGEELDPAVLFAAEHIPGSVFFDIDAVASCIGELPHMMPDAETFGAAVARLGLCPDKRLVFYDQRGVASAACRAWWTFRSFGYERLHVLDGGLPAWRARSGRTEEIASEFEPCTPKLDFDPLSLRSLAEVLENVDSAAEQLVDARSVGRFCGVDEEPWGRPGRIPGSLNLHFEQLLDQESGRFLAREEIRARFVAAGVDLERRVVASCGSGVTACVLLFGLHLLGCEDAALYDGSWAEWVRSPETPKIPANGD